jgi:hypothetical protein
MAKTPHVGQSIIHRDPYAGTTEKLVVQQVNPKPQGPHDFAFAAGWSLESANRVYVRPDDWIPAELDPSAPSAPVPGPLERHMAQRAADGLAQKTHDALERAFGIVPNAPKKEKAGPEAAENPERENQKAELDDMLAVVRGLDTARNNRNFMRNLAVHMEKKGDTAFMINSRFVFLSYYSPMECWALEWGPYGGQVYREHTISACRPTELISKLRNVIVADIPYELRP